MTRALRCAPSQGSAARGRQLRDEVAFTIATRSTAPRLVFSRHGPISVRAHCPDTPGIRSPDTLSPAVPDIGGNGYPCSTADTARTLIPAKTSRDGRGDSSRTVQRSAGGCSCRILASACSGRSGPPLNQAYPPVRGSVRRRCHSCNGAARRRVTQTGGHGEWWANPCRLAYCGHEHDDAGTRVCVGPAVHSAMRDCCLRRRRDDRAVARHKHQHHR